MTFTREDLDLIAFALLNLSLGDPRKFVNSLTLQRAEQIHNRITPEVARMKDAEREAERNRGYVCLVTGCNQAVGGPGQRCFTHRGIHA